MDFLTIGFRYDFCCNFGSSAGKVSATNAKLILAESGLTLWCTKIAPQQNVAFTRAEFSLELSNKALRGEVTLIGRHAGFGTSQCQPDPHDRASKSAAGTASACHAPTKARCNFWQ